ncbi:MAG TPA: response regulator [Anaeromyxobacteraceae bacterium]
MRRRARSIEPDGQRGERPRYRTLIQEYQALAGLQLRAHRRASAWLPERGAQRRSPAGGPALRETVERERQQAMGELASTSAHEMNNVLHAMALRLASLQDSSRGELTGGVDALARMVADAAGMVRRLQDRAGKSRCEAQFTRTPVPERAMVRLRVLVVDDDPDVLEAAGFALEHLGQQVDLAASGVEAVSRVMAGERYDLVLCDLGMPQLDGWQVAREVAELAPGTHLYLVSGWGREFTPEQAAQVGVEGMLAKPLSLEALRSLLAATAAVLAGQEGASTSERREQAQAPGGVVRNASAPQLEAHDPAPR